MVIMSHRIVDGLPKKNKRRIAESEAHVNLRPYQKDLYDKASAEFARGNRRVLVVSPCGSGKTILMAQMADIAQKRGKNVWVILPRQEIMEQTLETFSRCDIPLNTIYVGMAITTANKAKELPRPDLILFDECHISVADTYWKIVNHAPNAFIVGLTASPCRSDNKPLGSLYQVLVEGVTVKWLIDNKYLSPYEYYSVTVADLSTLSDCNDASEILMKSAVYGKVIENWQNLAKNIPTVCYCASVKHSQETAQAFREAGINAVHFDGTTPYLERKQIVERFRSGEITVLCNCDLISMGFDMPDIGCVVMLRPTNSASLYIQQSGRALRYKPNKIAIIIDAVANYARFQLPDEPYEWSLDKAIKQRTEINPEGDFYIRTCEQCYKVFKTSPVCPYCGAEYPLHPREIKAHEDIELARITAEEAEKAERERKKARMEQGRAQTFEELIAIGRAKGYKNPAYWAQQVLRGRRK